MERREVEALNASLREFLFPCFNCFSIERTFNWKILLESPPPMFYSSIGKIPAEYFMVKIPSNFLAFSSTFFFETRCVSYIVLLKKIYIFVHFRETKLFANHIFIMLRILVIICLCPSSYRFSILLQLRWYVRFNEKGVVRDRNGTRMRSRLLQRAVADNVRRITRSVTQEGWFSSRKGSFLEFRLPTLGADVISRFLDGELLFRSRIHSIF